MLTDPYNYDDDIFAVRLEGFKDGLLDAFKEVFTETLTRTISESADKPYQAEACYELLGEMVQTKLISFEDGLKYSGLSKKEFSSYLVVYCPTFSMEWRYREYSYDEDIAKKGAEAFENGRIREMIESFQELGQDYEFTLKCLMTKFSLSHFAARSRMKLYWKELPDQVQKQKGGEATNMLTVEYSHEEDIVANRDEVRKDEEYIRTLLETCYELKLTYDFIMNRLRTKFSLTPSEVESRKKIYWKEQP